MADSKITALTELTTVADADLLAIVDATDTVTKKITKANLVGTSVSSLMPLPAAPVPANTTIVSGATVGVNTSILLGRVIVPFGITVNSISFEVATVNTAGTFDLTVYSETGQTKLIDVTTASISTTGIKTTAVSSVYLSPGIYYLGINPNGTASIDPYAYGYTGISLHSGVTGEPDYAGVLTITAGTPPTTFDTTALTTPGTVVPLFRFDN